jgi:heme-degrading monooxygenase HmoA
MITFSRTFLLPQDNRDTATEKIRHLYTEVMPLQSGFIASKLDFSEDGSQVVAIANWESEERFIALQETEAFRDLARQIG